jgi:hypothetical protein
MQIGNKSNQKLEYIGTQDFLTINKKRSSSESKSIYKFWKNQSIIIQLEMNTKQVCSGKESINQSGSKKRGGKEPPH